MQGPISAERFQCFRHLFSADHDETKAAKVLGRMREIIAAQLNLIEKNVFKFTWIVDYPMYELSDEKKVEFSHNPFSMPQGGLEALTTQDPLTLFAYQYDLVCNGYEIASGAIRNHVPEVMYKAFEIAGYDQSVVDTPLRRHDQRLQVRRAAARRNRPRASTASSCCWQRRRTSATSSPSPWRKTAATCS